jgi:pseudouridine-5'-phosphate glycosidase
VSALVKVSPGVAEALAAHRAVVALESTVVTHGLPRPNALDAARSLEAEVSSAGALPATVGVLDGTLRVGLSEFELGRLATARDAAKVNLSNLAATLATGGVGSTTVAATMFASARVGIRVFATGGIGGVHRDAEKTGDVSADLTALATFPVAVVCAGAKAVLDLSKTVEMLETLGVPVLGFGSDAFPAFYRRDSGLGVDRRFDQVDDLARAIRLHFDLGSGSGVVVANPVPEEGEMPRDVYESALAEALGDASRKGVRGRDVTPFLLDRLRELTAGKSVFSNLELLRNNARLAARLAVAMTAAG